MLISELVDMEVAVVQAAASMRDARDSLAGLESRFQDAITRLAKPHTAVELQGLAEFLLMSSTMLREYSDRMASQMELVGVEARLTLRSINPPDSESA